MSVEGGLGATVDIGISAVDDGHSLLDAEAPPKKPKRLCRFPGCTKVVKSQGHCQRHGAKPKRCRIPGCEKQQQGTFDGMCKKHWKNINFPEQKEEKLPPAPQGESVYDQIIPASIAYKPSPCEPGAAEPPDGYALMPLVRFLKEHTMEEFGWHRKAERRARGLFPLSTLKTQLEAWERQLALVETLLLSGGTPFACWRNLAHAWGRDVGFHSALSSAVCKRRGNVERKKRAPNDLKKGKAGAEESDSKKLKTDPLSGETTMGGPHEVNNTHEEVTIPTEDHVQLGTAGETVLLETLKPRELAALLPSKGEKDASAVETAATSIDTTEYDIAGSILLR